MTAGQRVCKYCGESGHYQKTCSKRKQAEAVAQGVEELVEAPAEASVEPPSAGDDAHGSVQAMPEESSSADDMSVPEEGEEEDGVPEEGEEEDELTYDYGDAANEDDNESLDGREEEVSEETNVEDQADEDLF